MNRQTKRMLARQRATPQDRLEAMRQRRAVAVERRRRTPPTQFLKEVRQELRKVVWPSRQEVVAYATVVLVTVVVLTALVFGLDWAFANGILRLFGQGS
ncbi:MAG TPA: preprotein translocase subunit SecE [Actinomycetota bacterium]|nr:preprotein translocase subunit SecE [Actinomycetota bacterium]